MSWQEAAMVKRFIHLFLNSQTSPRVKLCCWETHPKSKSLRIPRWRPWRGLPSLAWDRTCWAGRKGVLGDQAVTDFPSTIPLRQWRFPWKRLDAIQMVCVVSAPKTSFLFCSCLVQSLNSPYFPPPIETEPGRAIRESRITCMRMLRTPAFSPPNRGKKQIWKYSPDLTCGAILWMMIYKQQFLHSDWLKTCQLIPNQWNFTSSTLNYIQLVFFLFFFFFYQPQYQK